MRSWLRTWVLFAATAWPVGILLRTVHEVIGHGLIAEAIGGRFLSFYLSPVRGFAEFNTAPGVATLLALGAATPLTSGLGLLAWAATRRSERFVPRVAGWYCLLGALTGIGAWGLYPGLASRSRALAGDWSVIWRAWHVSPLIPGAVTLALLAVLGAVAIADARRIVTVQHPAPSWRGASAAYWLLALAAVLPKACYLVAFWPHWRPTDRALFAFDLGLPLALWLGGMIGMPLARRLGWAGPGDAETAGRGLRMPDPPAALACVVILLASTLGVAYLFGPATRLRSGLQVRALTADDYFEVDTRTEVEWALDADGSGRLTVRSTPPAHADSPFEERRTGEADRLGPSRAACERVLEAVASEIDAVALQPAVQPDRSQGAWRCAAPISVTAHGITFVVPEGAAALTITAPGLATRRYSAQGVPLALSPETARWVRPDGFRGTDAVRVKF